MPRRRPVQDENTPDLFEVPQPAGHEPGSQDYRCEVSAKVGQVLAHADGDRYEIAARMSRLAGRDVSKYMLDAWSAESREDHNIPFWAVPVLEAACETHELTRWLTEERGGRLLIGREALQAELGKLERMKEDAQRQIKELKKVMGEEG